MKNTRQFDISSPRVREKRILNNSVYVIIVRTEMTNLNFPKLSSDYTALV